MSKNITATVLIILAIGIYLTVAKGMFTQVTQVKAINDQYRSAIDSAKQLIQVRDNVQKDYNNLSADDRERLEKMIPNTVDNIRLVIDLNAVALRHGFSLRNIKAAVSGTGNAGGASGSQKARVSPIGASSNSQASIAIPVLDTVDISFSVTAPYQQFRDFMQDLEANLRIMDIKHLSITGSDNGIYSFGVELQTYWLRSQ